MTRWGLTRRLSLEEWAAERGVAFDHRLRNGRYSDPRWEPRDILELARREDRPVSFHLDEEWTQ